MPHKRAKNSARQDQRTQRGSNHAPRSQTTLSAEDVPKSALRVLNAAKIRTEYRARKRSADEDLSAKGSGSKRRKKNSDVKGGDDKGKAEMKIHPGESLAHFNRRVEDNMRGVVRSAMHSSSAHARKAQKTDLEAPSSSKSAPDPKKKLSRKLPSPSPSPEPTTHASASDKPKEFATSTPRRVNDVAQAPPELRLKKAAKLGVGGGSKASGVLSMAQRTMMEAERELAIKRYRELKERRVAAGAVQGARG